MITDTHPLWLRLFDYSLDHKAWCATGNSSARKCNCGLSELLKELKNRAATPTVPLRPDWPLSLFCESHIDTTLSDANVNDECPLCAAEKRAASPIVPLRLERTIIEHLVAALETIHPVMSEDEPCLVYMAHKQAKEYLEAASQPLERPEPETLKYPSAEHDKSEQWHEPINGADEANQSEPLPREEKS